MSNETDLDWLARNVHVWKSGYDLAVVQRGIEEIYVTWPSACSSGITKKEWLSRRAELQNKPSWSKAEEWAEWLAQDSYGCWGFFQKKPLMHALSWIARSGYYQIHSPGNSLLGDWRDTLEKRPADLSEQAVTARLKEATDNVLAAAPGLMTDKYKFEPFVSVEDAKLTIMQSDGDVKHFGGIIGRRLPLEEDAATAKNCDQVVTINIKPDSTLIHQPRGRIKRITTSKYTKTIHGVSVDVYDVLMAWGVTNPALQHLIKKALQCGQRGHKDNEQDLQDIIDSAIRAKELG